LNFIGNIAEGNLEFMESFSHLSWMRAPSLKSSHSIMGTRPFLQ
jgi:hypothetical protein